MEFVDEMLESLLLLGSPSQQEHHVIHREVVGDAPAIIRRVRFRARVTPEDNPPGAGLLVRENILCGS